jgi:hypothetical protein
MRNTSLVISDQCPFSCTQQAPFEGVLTVPIDTDLQNTTDQLKVDCNTGTGEARRSQTVLAMFPYVPEVMCLQLISRLPFVDLSTASVILQAGSWVLARTTDAMPTLACCRHAMVFPNMLDRTLSADCVHQFVAI